MKIIKSFTLIVALVLLLTKGCKKSNKSTNTVDQKLNQTADSQNSSDWEGTYFGVLPCASCPGINTLITLKNDGTYEKTVEYLESNDVPKTAKGQYSQDKNGRITIEGTSYLLESNRLYLLDRENKKMDGELADHYILNKTDLQPAIDSNEGYTLQTFVGSDNKNYNIVFNTNPKIPTAFVETEGMSKMLSQTDAWAKGTEYSGSNMNLRVQGDKATLTLDGQKIELSTRE